MNFNQLYMFLLLFLHIFKILNINLLQQYYKFIKIVYFNELNLWLIININLLKKYNINVIYVWVLF